MANRNAIYLHFFRAVQAIEDILDVVEKRSIRWGDDVALFRNELEYAVDQTIRMSAERTWEYAYTYGDFSVFYHEFDAFARRHWNSILLAEEEARRQ